jgi:hypothetical protein
VTKREKSELKELTEQLLCEHGHLLTGQSLWRALGFKSSTAFRQAKSRDVIGVKLFNIPNRRGSFVTTRGVAEWLYQMSNQGEDKL